MASGPTFWRSAGSFGLSATIGAREGSDVLAGVFGATEPCVVGEVAQPVTAIMVASKTVVVVRIEASEKGGSRLAPREPLCGAKRSARP